MHSSLDEFEFRQETTNDYGFSCPWAFKQAMYPLFFSVAVDPILFKLASKEVDQLANLHFHFTSVPRCTPMTD